MMTTKVLGEAVGVQWDGLQDRTASNTKPSLTQGLIIGSFKRGRVDKPMLITSSTIKARLGYEPTNPMYQLVQDCLDQFPSVWVLRVSEGENLTPPVGQISCEGATDYMSFTSLSDDWEVYVDNIYYPSPYNPAATIRNNLSSIIDAQDDGYADFYNLDTAPHRIMFKPKLGFTPTYTLGEENNNQSFMELEDGSIVFCLAPQQV